MKLLILLIVMHSTLIWAQAKKPETTKGTLSEIKVNDKDESKNEETALKAELLITQTELKAIAALEKLIQKNKNKPEEANLLFRLGELYMRRSKSGRFFDLIRDNQTKSAKLAAPLIKDETSNNSLRKAITVYSDIEKRYPEYFEMDAVIFNKAFAEQQIGLKTVSLVSYKKLINTPRYQNSRLIPDALLAAGEIEYDMQNYQDALVDFEKIENFPNSKVYAYGIYKAGWTLYNLKKTDEAIKRLVKVVRYHDDLIKKNQTAKQDLRKEALSDILLFYADFIDATKILAIVEDLTEDKNEIGELTYSMAKLYLGYSRFKELNIFLNRFVDDYSDNYYRAKAHMILSESYENIKERDKVVEQLTTLSQICDTKSAWREKHKTQAQINEMCDLEVGKVILQTTEKWWEITKKNNGHKDIAGVTEKAFRLYVGRDSVEKPDTKTRYAFAEFLFQQKKFREASENYEFVSTRTQDATFKHDSSYAAIYSLEKAREAKDSKKEDVEHLIKLCQYYVTHQPQGEHFSEISLKTAVLYYEAEKYPDSEKWLLDLLKTSKNTDHKEKAQDLLLDIFNIQKRYSDISKLSDEILKSKPSDARKDKVKKIQEQAEYTIIQDKLLKGDKLAGAEDLIQYAKKFKDAELNRDAWLQAISLYYTSPKKYRGAELGEEFANLFPKDEKSVASLQEAVKVYTENGDLLRAAKTLEKLAIVDAKNKKKWFDFASEYYLMEGKVNEAKKALEFLAQNAQKDELTQIINRQMVLAKENNDQTEISRIEKLILSQNIEPQASELRLKKVEALYDQGKLTEVFNESKKFVSSGINSEIKAKARILQAKVLEKELVSQSVKTKIDRLTIVLSLKTEKLDKAQSAYLDVVRFSQEPQIQLAALEGLSRSYNNYVQSVQNMQITEEITEEDKKILSGELAKLTSPIYAKLEEVNDKIAKLTGQEEQKTKYIDFTTLKEDETFFPHQILPNIENFYGYLTIDFKSPINRDLKYDCKKIEDKDLKLDEKLIGTFKACFAQAKYETAQDNSLRTSIMYPDHPMGPYLMSFLSEKQKLVTKSHWMMELALKRMPDSPILKYQHARLLYQKGETIQALNLLDKVIEAKVDIAELKAIQGISAYANSDYKKAVEILKDIPVKDQIRLNTLNAYSESLAQLGEKSKSIDVIKSALKDQKNVYTSLQLGRIYEKYSMDAKSALKSYQEVLQNSDKSDQSLILWLESKINYLKNQNSSDKK